MFNTLYKTIILASVTIALVAGPFVLLPVDTIYAQETAAEIKSEAASDEQNPGIVSSLLGLAGSAVGGVVSTIVAFPFAWIMASFMQMAGMFLGVVGIFLNTVVLLLVIEMGSLITRLEGIAIAWTVLRDIANIVFVFALLFIGIATILNLRSYGYKQLLARLILVALFINFSLFFTKVIIDVSNLFATEIYSLIIRPGSEADCASLGFFSAFTDTTAFTNCANGGLTGAFMDQLWITTIYDSTSIFGTFNDNSNSEDQSYFQIGMMAFFAMILFLIVAFVFFAGAIMLITRFVVLVILLIFSPIAFIAMVLPQTQGIASQWWSALFKQSFFAPAFFLMIWISLLILDGLREPLGLDQTGVDFARALNGDTGAITVILNFAIVVGFLIGSLIVANRLGAHGSSTLIQTGKRWGLTATGSTTSFLAANTVGRGARWAGRKYESGQARLQDSLESKEGDGRAKRVSKSLARFATRQIDKPVRSGFQAAENAKYNAGLGGGASIKERTDTTKARDREISQNIRITHARDYIKEAERLREGQQLDADKLAHIKSLHIKEMEQIGLQNFTHANVAELVTKSQSEAIHKSDEFTQQLKGVFKKARFENLNKSIDAVAAAQASGNVGQWTTLQSGLERKIKTMSRDVKGELDAKILASEHVAPALTRDDLNYLARKRDNLTQEQRHNIYLNVNRNGTNEARQFFGTNIGQSWTNAP